MNHTNCDATKSMKGYYHQFHETILYLINENINEIKLEGLEDIDLLYNDGSVLIQIKYHNKTKSNNEHFGKDSGFFKVYKSFILNNDKYNNINEIIYYCFCEDELKGCSQFKLPHDEFISFLKKN